MPRHSGSAALIGVAAAVASLVLAGLHGAFAADSTPLRGAGPPDPPASYSGPPAPISGPSLVQGQPAGIEVGQCAPDFQLEPIQLYADFEKWLGPQAPKKFEDQVMLSNFVGKAPILLLFGSYT
jgi:hypothetical protein